MGFYATLVNINAYDQPGVEAGKRAAGSVLDLQRALVGELLRRGGEEAGCEELAAAVGAADEVETAFKILERLSANPTRNVVRTPGASPFEATYRFQ